MVDTVEALIEQLIDRASGWAQLGYWHIGQEEDIRQALELRSKFLGVIYLIDCGEDSAESLAIYLKNGKRLLEASKGEIGERERSVLVDLACEMLKSARKIVLLGRRKLFSPKEIS
ncbi:unnamed protein product [Brassica oleracea var. botrytis]|uniref:Uncharacterized protein n=1 Tax=Brassica oleracea TaxID=3712 RepID=A0A3P6G6R3_BRAOL|nr:unnamed protein product [Brassica oleracea]